MIKYVIARNERTLMRTEPNKTNDMDELMFHHDVVGNNFNDLYLPPHLILLTRALPSEKKYELSCMKTKLDSKQKTQCCACF